MVGWTYTLVRVDLGPEVVVLAASVPRPASGPCTFTIAQSALPEGNQLGRFRISLVRASSGGALVPAGSCGQLAQAACCQPLARCCVAVLPQTAFNGLDSPASDPSAGYAILGECAFCRKCRCAGLAACMRWAGDRQCV